MGTEAHGSRLPGILRLSPEIRRRIYLRVSLGPREVYYRGTVPRVYDLGGKDYDSYSTVQHPRPKRPVLFHGLLVSCRTIYTEASALLYSSNWFIYHYQNTQSLAPLRALRAGTIASLTNLRVILNQSSCHCNGPVNSEECCDYEWPYEIYYRRRDDSDNHGRHNYCAERHQSLHDPPIRGSDPSARKMLTEWHTTAAHLASHLNPGQLELSFVCDVHDQDVELAKSVVNALRPFPRLKDCHIRLSKTPDSRLRDLARDAVLQARGILLPSASASTKSPPGPRLITLPREVRLRILEYTDLIAPLKEVLWTRAHGKYLASRSVCPSWEGRGDHSSQPTMHHGCQFTHCAPRPYPEISIGCFCRRTHAAFSSTCRCWAPPTPLLLVCRTLHEDANLVFFSENRFVVIDGPGVGVCGPPVPSGYDQNGLAASRFLREVVPVRCLGSLRFLELVFPPYTGGSWPEAEHATYREWSETIHWARDKLNAPALTIRTAAKYHSDEGVYREDDELTSELTGGQAKETMDAYMRILSPLACLGGSDGLAKFYAELTWPWRRTRSVLQRYDHETEALMETKERWLKERAERLVLGDRYDGQSLGAEEPQAGAWLWLFTRDC